MGIFLIATHQHTHPTTHPRTHTDAFSASAEGRKKLKDFLRCICAGLKQATNALDPKP